MQNYLINCGQLQVIKLNQSEIDKYKEFGKIRNQIIHTSIAKSDKSLDVETLEFSLQLLDPLIESFWGKSVIEFIVNDPHPDYPTEIVEDAIRKHFTIDQQLRRLLGEPCREAWENMNAHFERMNQFDSEMSTEDWEAYVKDNAPSQEDYDPQTEEIEEQRRLAEANWKRFLSSF